MGQRIRRVLFESAGITLLDVRCRAHVEPEGPEEGTPRDDIVLARRGVFGHRREREFRLVDANHVLFLNAGEVYRFSHPLAGGDDCTVLALSPERARDLVARHAPRDAERARAPFRAPHALSTPRLARLHYELLALVGRAPALAVEDALSELAEEAVRAAHASAPGGAPTADRARLEAIQLAVHERLESPPRLAELARRCGCSPFHVSRIFRETAGVSLRRYVKRLRARAAADRIREGAGDLTELALDLGYADHSHLTNSFRQEWGVAPSRFRAAARKNFQARA